MSSGMGGRVASLMLVALALFAALPVASAASMPCIDGTSYKLANGTIDESAFTYDNCAYESEAAYGVANLATKVGAVEAAIDFTYYFLCASLVFLMQLGFAMLEVGAVQEKNTSNIIIKGTLDMCTAAVSFWAIGWAIAFGGGEPGSFIGGAEYYFGRCLGYEPECAERGYTSGYQEWFFQFAFAAAAATIVSGSVAERCTTLCYVIYAWLLTGFVYPVVVHWQWGGGLTGAAKPDGFGAVDYAGSGVVHMTGGLSAIIGAIALGPRIGRFEEGSKPFKVTVNELPQFSVVFMALGTLILWFGWYGFNVGSTLGIVWVAETDAPGNSEAGLVMINTTLAPAAGGLTAMFCAAQAALAKGGHFSLKLEPVLNGILAGLVSITAGCGDVRPFSAIVMGMMGGFIYTAAAELQLQLMIDDVCNAGPVHFFCGVWGVLAVGLFADETGTGLSGDLSGLFYSGGGELFASNLLLVIMIIVWIVPTMSLIFFSLRFAGLARVSASVETIGLDISKHGVKSASCSPNKPFTEES